jgi:hypothetical protein
MSIHKELKDLQYRLDGLERKLDALLNLLVDDFYDTEELLPGDLDTGEWKRFN